MEKWNVVRGLDQELMASVDTSSFDNAFGASMWAVHRVDLHNELQRLAKSTIGPGRPIRIHLASEVVDASIAEGNTFVKLKDGTIHAADLIVAADGLHSALKHVVLGDVQRVSAPLPTGLSAFRFLLDADRLNESDEILQMLREKGHVATLLADTTETTRERHIMWYPCRGYADLGSSRCC